MWGPLSNSSTLVPNAWNMEAICTPVLPAPTTSIDAGTAVNANASLCVRVSSKPGTAIRRLTPPVQMITFSARSRGPRSVSIVCGSTKRAEPTRS